MNDRMDGDSMELPYFTVDAFTKTPFSGNPAGVCLVTSDQAILDELKQKIATEMNLSETAFVSLLNPDDDFSSANCFQLRWFTPTNEVALCGHATLSTAAVLFQVLKNPNLELEFRTLSGSLFAKRYAEKIALNLPLNTPEKQDEAAVANLVRIATGTLPYMDVQYSPVLKYLMIRLNDSVTMSDLEKINPPAQLMLHTHSTGTVQGVILTLRGTPNNGCVSADGRMYDFVSRFFAPWHGVNEDPVTGSTHTVLGGYWSQVLEKKEMFARQCSRRGGELWVNIEDNGRCDVIGNAAIFIRGSLVVTK